jgi:hypothetical protein
MDSKITFIITSIKTIIKTKYNNVILSLQCGDFIINGTSKIIPFINDIILNDLDQTKKPYTPKNKKELLKFSLPVNEIQQKERLQKILNTNNIDYFNNNFIFDNKLWINIKNKYNQYIENDIINNDYQLLLIIVTHINKYSNIIEEDYKTFNNLLISHNIYIKHNLLILLYHNKYFGPDILKWKYNNLYILFDIKEFTFKIILYLSTISSLNIKLDEKNKLIIYSLLILNYNNDCYIKNNYNIWTKYFQKSSEYINITHDKFLKLINELINDNKFILIQKYNILYNINILNKELYLSNKLIQIKNKINFFDNFDINKIKTFLKIYKSNNLFSLNKQQRQAILSLFINNVVIINGKAGTGKSSLLKAIVDLFDHINYNAKIIFLTPTGKSKMRIEEIINNNLYSLHTIHSFNYRLKEQIEYDNSFFKKNKNIILIIDETSMIDIFLLYELLYNLDKHDINLKLIFLGDTRQLPSIGMGDILNCILISESFSNNELIINNRNDKSLSTNLDLILNNKLPEENNNFKWYKNENILEQINKNINELRTQIDHVGTEMSLKNNKDFIILTPTNNNILKYTNTIKNVLNDNIISIELNYKNNLIIYNHKNIYYNFYYKKIENKIYNINDKVIHNKNMHVEKIYNGMTGIITNIIPVYNDTNIINFKIVVCFDTNNRVHEYSINDLQMLELAYILTIHKSQGSEYNTVFVIINDNYNLSLNLLYTAFSRAKNNIILIASEEFIKEGINNKVKRKSLLNIIINYYDDINNNQPHLLQCTSGYNNNNDNNNNEIVNFINYLNENYI